MKSRLVLVALVLATLSCGTDHDEHEDENAHVLYRLRLESAPELASPSLLERPSPHISQMVQAILDLKDDEHAAGLFLHLSSMQGAWGRATDLTDALRALRDAHKPVHCHFDELDNVGFLFAANSCDRLTMSPAGTLDLVGVAAQSMYARQLLANVGVSADLLQVGDFKGAAEPLTRDDMSPEMRVNLEALLEDLHGQLLASVALRTGAPLAGMQALIDQGPFPSGRAKELHLVDDQAYDDGAIQAAKDACHADRVRTLEILPEAEPVTLGNLIGALSGDHDEEDIGEPHIVVAHLSGEITDAEDNGAATGRRGPFIRAMRRFARDENVRAVVLRINSPGGSALASDEMWHAVRRVAAVKPVVVSIGDMAASGGYYIASAAHRIFAHSGSIVGSIGVVGGKMSFERLMEDHGVHTTTISRGENATWSSITHTFSTSERAALLALMRDTYQRFLRRVAEGRGREVEQIEPFAEGRIFSGSDAHENGLVDELGGLLAALQYARERATLDQDTPIVEWPRERSWMEVLATIGEDDEDSQELRVQLRNHMSNVAVHSVGATLERDLLAESYATQLLHFAQGPSVRLVHPYWLYIR